MTDPRPDEPAAEEALPPAHRRTPQPTARQVIVMLGLLFALGVAVGFVLGRTV